MRGKHGFFNYYFVFFRYLRSNKKRERNKVRLLSFFISQLFDQKIVLLSEAMKFNLSVVNKERLGKDNGDSNGDEVVKNAVGLVSKQQPYTPN